MEVVSSASLSLVGQRYIQIEMLRMCINNLQVLQIDVNCLRVLSIIVRIQMAWRRVLLLPRLLLRTLANFVLLMNPYALAIFKLRRAVLLELDFRVLDAAHRIHQPYHLLLRLHAVFLAIFAEMGLTNVLSRP